MQIQRVKLYRQSASIEACQQTTSIEACRQLWLSCRQPDNGNPRVVCCAVCQQALLAVDRHIFWEIFKSDSKFVSSPNSELLVFFSSWVFCVYKEGYCPYWLQHELINLNKITLPFYPKDVGNCWTSLNLCFLTFCLVCFVLAIYNCSVAKILVFALDLRLFPTSSIRAFQVFDGELIRVEQITLKTCRRFHFKVMIWSLSI